jgi:hypothetical protein
VAATAVGYFMSRVISLCYQQEGPPTHLAVALDALSGATFRWGGAGGGRAGRLGGGRAGAAGLQQGAGSSSQGQQGWRHLRLPGTHLPPGTRPPSPRPSRPAPDLSTHPLPPPPPGTSCTRTTKASARPSRPPCRRRCSC